MGFTTLGALVTNIAGMSVTGIASGSKFGFRPKRINAAQLPILYTRLPTRKNDTATLGYAQDLKQATIEVVILSALMNLDTQANNDATTVTLIDALADALETNAETLGLDSYEIVPDEDIIGENTPVQAIIATVEVSG